MRNQDAIDRIATTEPCRASWEGMAGDDRARHCTACNLDVYNFAAMSRDEIGELLNRSEGRVCARLCRRTDGTLVTRSRRSSGRGLRRSLRRLLRGTAAMLVGLTALFSGCASTGKAGKVAFTMDRTAARHAVVTGVVVDSNGMTLPGVTVVVRDEATGREVMVVTGATGQFDIGDLPSGHYRLEASLTGIESAVASHLRLSEGDVARARVELRLNTGETVTVGAIVIEPLGDGTTWFSEDYLRHVPFE